MSEVVTRPAANGTDHQTVCGTDDESTARACITCGEAKPLNEFAKDRWKRQGRRGMCAVCRTNYDRERDYLRRCRRYGHSPVIESFTKLRDADVAAHTMGPFVGRPTRPTHQRRPPGLQVRPQRGQTVVGAVALGEGEQGHRAALRRPAK